MAQLNQMYAYMEQAMARERARHSCDLHMLMRKVDKDLRDAFSSVRDTFMSLTKQVQLLLREVEAGKKSIASIQAKFDAAKTSAAIRAQYVEELEAVLDGQVPNISESMRKLSEDLTSARLNAEKISKEAEDKEEAMAKERTEFRAVIRSLEERLNEKEVLGLPGTAELPVLPEMTTTWTRREQRPQTSDSTSLVHVTSDNARPQERGSLTPDDGGSTSGRQQAQAAHNGVDILGTAMARSDATRGATRMKSVKPLGKRPSSTPSSIPIKQWGRQPSRLEQQQLQAKVAELKKRVQAAEQRVAKQQTLFLEAAPSLQLLREIFSELRNNWRLRNPEQDPGGLKDVETLRAEYTQVNKAPDILDRITQLFVEAFPRLGTFSEVLDALCEEASRPAPQLSCVINSLEVGSVYSDDGLSGGALSPVVDNSSGAGDRVETNETLGAFPCAEDVPASAPQNGDQDIAGQRQRRDFAPGALPGLFPREALPGFVSAR